MVVTAVQMMLSMIAERWLPRIHSAMGGQQIEGLRLTEVEGVR